MLEAVSNVAVEVGMNDLVLFDVKRGLLDMERRGAVLDYKLSWNDGIDSLGYLETKDLKDLMYPNSLHTRVCLKDNKGLFSIVVWTDQGFIVIKQVGIFDYHNFIISNYISEDHDRIKVYSTCPETLLISLFGC